VHLKECISQSAVETKFQQHTTNGKQIVRELHSMMELIFESAISRGYVHTFYVDCLFRPGTDFISLLIRAVLSTRVARAYSSSKKLKLYFWAWVLDNFFANAKQQLKMANLFSKRLSHNYGTNLALLGTMQINFGTVLAVT